MVFGTAPQKFKGYILDLDGVVYRGSAPVPGALAFIARLRAARRKIIFLSNASFGSRAAIAAKLRSMGIKCKDSEVINSGYVTAQYIKKKFGKCTVFVAGEQGLMDELQAAGVRVQKPGAGLDVRKRRVRKKGACAVVAGFDRHITYEKIADALDLLLAGVPFIASNSDPTYPVENRLLPGAGMVVGALEGCSGRKPLVLGKPNPLMLRACLAAMHLKPSEVAVVGDRLETDILMANKAKVYSILVLTGVSGRKHAQSARGFMKPKLVVKNLRGLESS
ncbi:MAG: HAD-IIA family hydrolase [Candidatus Burarchaeum sp.]|nr:HAD-IIA family hydrolase [Candidatus Burarchaeum sp.]MDO8339230.1 HAD-IIA family hydrolase [Candidatus Burarchaeum sp.]